jgi:hypothetical protein
LVPDFSIFQGIGFYLKKINKKKGGVCLPSLGNKRRLLAYLRLAFIAFSGLRFYWPPRPILQIRL